MSQVITNAFEQYWQSSLAAEQPVVLDEFILADIPNLDITSPIDPDAGLPPESQIVHRQNVDQRGRINTNAVAYSIVMDTTVGDFSFNAMYLRNKANGVIGMIVYKGRETKLKTDQTTGQAGNSLVKSMLMGYDQAAEATLTNVDAGTWQIDYAARLRGQDEDLRQLASQLYGHHTFIGDGFKVVQQDGGHQVTQGVAIVGGLRIELKQPEVIYPGTKPIGVWVDVHRSGSLLSEHQNHFTIITSVADLTDHVDESGYQHYVAKLGTVQVDSTVIDDRGQSGSGGSGAIPDTFALWKRSMAEAGYDLIGQFGSKLTINNAKQVLLSKDGIEVYAWLGALPKEVGKNDTTDNSGGVGVGAWSPITNELLRSAIISFSGKLAAEPAWPDVPKHADPAMASGLDAQAMALLGRIEKLNERANQKAISLYDKGGVPDIDCTASILAALSSTAGSIVVPAGDWLATPTLANVHQVLAVLSRLHAEGNLLIRVPDGTAVGGATALCNLSGSGAVSVVGATTPTLNSITGFVSASGVAGAWDVTLQMNSVAGMTVGDFLHTTDVTGTGAAAIHRGCWPILAINTGSNQVTVRNNCWKAAFPTHTISSSNTYCIKSVLKFNNSDGFFGRRGQLFMDNVIVRGNASDYWLKTNVSGTEKGTHGIYAGGPSVSLNGKADAVNPTGLSGASFGLGKMVGVYDFDQQGIVTELGGWIWGDFVSSCFNRRRGFYASTSSGIRAKHISACGNYLDGAICDIGGQLYASSSSCAAGNGQRGITASSTGSIVFDSGLLVANGLDGGYATSNGMIQATSATVIQNGGNGLLGEYGGTVYCNNSNISDNGNHGLYGATCSVFRANNCTINNNGAFGVRGDLGAYINYQGSTFSGNASGEVTLAGDAKVTKDSNFGGAMYGSQLNIRYLTTGNGVQLSPLSGGEAMSFGFDTAAANKYTVSYILSSNGNGFYPSADDYQALGRASNRWKTLFAGDGAINTSDGREKIAPLAITDTVLDAWADVELITFQWLDSIQQKGEDVARWHYGVIAQQVRDSFAAHDIDGTRFGLLCYDEWDDEFEPIMEWREDPKTGLMEEFDTGDVRQTLAAGNRWGIRPDQCLFLEAALQRRKMKRLEERVAELEGSR